jgi:hypothetical protein
VPTYDLEGHPWSDDGLQGFRLAHGDPETLTPDDRLRLTDRATGHVSFWRVADATRTDKGWRGILTQDEA